MVLEDSRVLVTGGAGFIGTALARKYADHARRWVIFDNFLSQVHGTHPQGIDLPNVEVVRGDVRDGDLLSGVVADLEPEVVVHLAAETGTGQSLTEPSRHTDVNVTGTAVLFEALEKHLPNQFLLTSSRAVYGEGTWVSADGAPIRPGPRPAGMLAASQWDFAGLRPLPASALESVPDPANVYGATKLAQEHLLRAWASSRRVESKILRLQNVYGPGQSPINPYTGITTLFVRLADRGEAIPVYEDGQITRDFVYIDDVVHALGAAASRQGSVLVDVGSGTPTSILDMALVIAKLKGSPQPIITGQYRLGDVRHASCDMSSSEWVRSASGPTTLQQGLAALVAWMDRLG